MRLKDLFTRKSDNRKWAIVAPEDRWLPKRYLESVKNWDTSWIPLLSKAKLFNSKEDAKRFFKVHKDLIPGGLGIKVRPVDNKELFIARLENK